MFEAKAGTDLGIGVNGERGGARRVLDLPLVIVDLGAEVGGDGGFEGLPRLGTLVGKHARARDAPTLEGLNSLLLHPTSLRSHELSQRLVFLPTKTHALPGEGLQRRVNSTTY